MNLFYDEDDSLRAERCYSWATGSGDLPRFLRNFLRTQDCLLHAVDGSKVLIVKSGYEYSYPVFHITAEVMWSAPVIRFDGIPASVQREEMYRITPIYMEIKPAASIFNPFPNRIHYALEPSDLAAQWDADDGCFRITASVPSSVVPEQNLYSAKTRLSATIITFFPGNVRFECISRHRITVHVALTDSTRGFALKPSRRNFFAPVARPLETYCTNKPLPKTPSGKSHEIVYDESYPGSEMDVCDDTFNDPNFRPLANTSPRKRKAQPLDLNFSPANIPSHGSFAPDDTSDEMEPDAEKRRKVITPMSGSKESSPFRAGCKDEVETMEGHDCETAKSETADEDEAIHSALTRVDTGRTKANGSPSWSSSSRSNRSSPSWSSPMLFSVKGKAPRIALKWTETEPAQDTKHVNKSDSTTPNAEGSGSQLPWSPSMPSYSRDDEADSTNVPCQGPSRHDSLEPTETSSIRHRGPELSQAEIVQNYREFEEQARRKTSRKGSAHSDDFADIFMDEDGAED